MSEVTHSACRLAKDGFSYVSGSSLTHAISARLGEKPPRLSTSAVSPALDLQRFARFFDELHEDPYSPGRRFRAYAQCRKSIGGAIEYGHFEQYMQTAKYNPDTGGIVRSYPLIDEALTTDPVFNALIQVDADIVDSYGLVGDPWSLSIGIHLFRYWATPDRPAYSSPVWLHRDDEDVVFLHLIQRSSNVIGGDNVIATDARTIERVLTLATAGDTLVVDHQKFHAVTPIGCAPPPSGSDETNSFRDIILVTFQKRSAA